MISPGPCRPVDAGISIEASRRFAEEGIPVLGVCLGHQAMAEAFGGTVVVGEPVHGKVAEVRHDGRTIFARHREPARRRAAITRWSSTPTCPTSSSCRPSSGDTVMGIRHRELPAEGVQFHPESVLTETGQADPAATSSATAHR